MKQRIISALMALIIVVPIIIIGGNAFNIGVYVVALLALKEFMDIKETKKQIPLFIKIMSVVFYTVMILSSFNNTSLALSMDYRLISGLFLSFLLPTVLYHDREKYSINDALYLMGGIFFLAVVMILLLNVRTTSLSLLIYLVLITTMTDTFAYITGLLIGKNKLLESISPKKTWEGTIGGTLFGTFISTMFYITVINTNVNVIKIILISGFLSILASLGDLVFSAIKRYYGKKDFSNLMPGHGGILDRLDSLIFVLLGFMFFI